MHVSQTGLSICIQNEIPLQESAVFKRSFTDSVHHMCKYCTTQTCRVHVSSRTGWAGKNRACAAEENQRFQVLLGSSVTTLLCFNYMTAYKFLPVKNGVAQDETHRLKRNTQLGPKQMIRAEEVVEIRGLFMEHEQMWFPAKGVSQDWFGGFHKQLHSIISSKVDSTEYLTGVEDWTGLSFATPGRWRMFKYAKREPILPMFTSSSVSASPMHSNWNSCSDWENFWTATERSGGGTTVWMSKYSKNIWDVKDTYSFKLQVTHKFIQSWKRLLILLLLYEC